MCIGYDGHVSFESAFHERCHYPSHDQQKDVPRLARKVASHLESPQCQPCIDIPVSMSLTDKQLLTSHVKPNLQIITSLFRPWVIPDNTFISIAIPQRFYSVTPHLASLQTVVLLV